VSASDPRAPARVLEARTTSPHETRALGRALAGMLRPGDVVLVSGDLGAGKTVLAQGVASGLGVLDAVTSPTFTLVRPLACGPAAGDPAGPGPVRTLLHADLYRLEHHREVVDLGLGELVEDDAVAVIEWGEAAEALLGKDALGIHLEAPADPGPAGAEARRVRVTVSGAWAARADALRRALTPWVSAGRPGDRPATAAGR
jgi:tRNA threonylcarbamoyladenosine biosynthesis protein TsaE